MLEVLLDGRVAFEGDPLGRRDRDQLAPGEDPSSSPGQPGGGAFCAQDRGFEDASGEKVVKKKSCLGAGANE